MDVRDCTACGSTRPLTDFAKDSRNKSGVRATCKPCDRAATRARRADARVGRKPGALVLVPKFPTPPADSSPIDGAEEAPAKTTSPGEVGSYSEAAEEFIAALDPPAADADALLVRSLRGLAELADRFSRGLDVVKDTRGLVTDMLRVQRELAATRAAKAGGQAAPVESAPAKRTAANY